MEFDFLCNIFYMKIQESSSLLYIAYINLTLVSLEYTKQSNIRIENLHALNEKSKTVYLYAYIKLNRLEICRASS